jgi:hypothetical protein
VTLKTAFEISNEDFLFTVKDEGGGLANLHCWVNKWSPRVLRSCYKAFVEAEKVLESKGFFKMITVTPNPKFAKLFGGRIEHTFTINNEYHEVIIWDLH